MYRKRHFLEYLLVSMLMLMLGNSVKANETTMLDAVTTGSLLVKADEQGGFYSMPLQQTQVEMHITGPIARTTLLQRFRNPGNTWLEAIYAFPLPENAAVDHMDLLVGERVIQGQIEEKQKARSVYTAAKQAGKNTALVEQHRPNLFTTSVANIPPGGEVSVKLQYQQQLSWRDDRFSVRFPMAITPRYKPVDRIEMPQQTVSGWSILPGEIPNAVPLSADEQNPAEIAPTEISIFLKAGLPLAELASRYHAISKKQTDDGVIEISLQQGAVKPDRDFVLEWIPEKQHQPKAAFFTEQHEDGQYGLLMVMPPVLEQKSTEIAREMLFIIDTSGSMGGESIRQARDALKMAIERLRPRDSFNIIEFNSSTRLLYNAPRRASVANKTDALSYITQLAAGGGTEMLPALKAALRMQPVDTTALQQVIFITDGAVGNEQQLLDYIQADLGKRRLFTVGIGSAPNSYFMKEAAHFGKGTFSFIGSPSEVREKMQSLFSRIEKPALTSLVLKTEQQVELLPGKLPDLYAGEPLSVAIKMGNEKLQNVTLLGRIGQTEWKQQLQLDHGSPQSGLDVHWGREKIRHWMRSQVRGVPQDKAREEILKLAFKHHLVSQYTSLVAVDITPVRPVEQTAQQHAIKGVLPAGSAVKTATITQPVMLASGATGAMTYVYAGLLLMLVSLIWQRLSGRFKKVGV